VKGVVFKKGHKWYAGQINKFRGERGYKKFEIWVTRGKRVENIGGGKARYGDRGRKFRGGRKIEKTILRPKNMRRPSNTQRSKRSSTGWAYDAAEKK